MTIGQTAKELLRQRLVNGYGLSYDEILETIRSRHTGARTTVASLRWYETKMRQAGEEVPRRISSRIRRQILQNIPQPQVLRIPQELTDRKFGIEIEAYNIPKTTLATALNEAGINCVIEGYNHSRRNHWKIVSDATLNRLVNPFELVSPPLSGQDGIRQLRIVC